MSKPVKGKGMETLRFHPKAPRETLKLGRKVRPTIEEGLQEQGFVTVKKKGRYNAIKQQVPLQKAKSNVDAGYFSGESSRPYATSPNKVEVRRHTGNPHFDNAVSPGGRGPLQPKRTGFWMDSRDGDLYSAVNHLISNGTSTSSDEYIGEQMSPEVLLARRYESSGAQNVAEAIKQLQESLHPTTIGTVAPIKDLGFQIRRGGLDPAKVLQHLNQGSRRYETNEHVIEEGEYEADAEELIRNYRMQGMTDEVGVKPSRARADNIRIARRLSSGRAGSANILASDPLDFDGSSTNKTFDKSYAHNYALHHLATSYLDADKYKGGTSSGLYKRHVELLQSRMHRHLSQAIPNVRKGFADLSDSDSQKEPLFYSNALPAVQTVAGWSDKFRVIDKPDIFQGHGSREAKSEYMSWINKSLKDMEYKYDASDRGGLARVYDPNSNATRQLLDQISVEHANDVMSAVHSDGNGFSMVSDQSEVLSEVLEASGVRVEDLRGSNDNFQAVVEAINSRDREQEEEAKKVVASLENLSVTGGLPAALDRDTKLHIKNIERSTQSGPTLHLTGEAAQRHMAGLTPTAPKTLQEAIEKVQAEQAAKVDPLEEYLAAHPNMRHIAHDDDKDDPMSLWMRIRRNKQTSSSINETTDPATRDTSFRDGLLKAMTPLDTPATIDLGNRAIEGGNNIEPEILSHLKNKDKRFEGLFSPGMLENIDLPGHATTPDAIINGGATNVEIKTRKDKFYNPNKEIRNKYDEQERVTYQKNWEQMQHQMYVTGARNTKLVEVIRDSNDPNQPMGRKGFVEGENYKVTDVPFDEKYVNRNKERWDREALAKQEFSRLDQGTQEAFKEILKAGVREGMGDAFEDLAKKNKISNADALRESLSKADIIPPPKEPKAKQANNAAAGSGGKQSKNNGGVSGGGSGSGNGGNGGTSVGAYNPAGKGSPVGKPNPFSHINGYSLDDPEEEAKARRYQFKSTKFLGFGLQGSASTWYGGVRQVLDNGARKAESAGTSGFGMLSRGMYGLNAAMSLSQVAYDAMKSANDKTVENSMNARSVGMTRDMYNANLATMKKGGYANEAAAANDIKHVALAVGGLGTGHVDRAVQLVEATRGAINFSDLKDIDRKDPNAINNLIEKGFGELKQRGIEGWEASAIMEQSGLMTMQRDIDATEGQRKLNDTLANIDTSITKFAAEAATAMGETIADPVDKLNKAITDGFEDANKYLKNVSDAFDSVKSFLGLDDKEPEADSWRAVVKDMNAEADADPTLQYLRDNKEYGVTDFAKDVYSAGEQVANYLSQLTSPHKSEYQGAQDGGNTNITVKVEDHRVLIEDGNGVRATASLPINHTEY